MIGGAILAAGKGTRIGVPKALLEMGDTGETFVRHAVRTLETTGGASPIAVVVSSDIAARVRELVPGVLVCVNPDPGRGQLSSLHVAIDALAAEPCDALIVLPVDVPLVKPETVSILIGVWRRLRPTVVRPTRGTEHGHPVIFDARVLGELRRADPAVGAKAIVRKHASVEGDVSIADEGAFIDIDTRQDYRRAFGRNISAPRTKS
jgi:CTP:molybdopterin cytidylyltransferase MocA